MSELNRKRAVAFFDGQNLYHHAKDAFGHTHPNYDPVKLFNAVCTAKNLTNSGIRFYTGFPPKTKSPFWHDYWSKRFLTMSRTGIVVVKREIRYRNTIIELPDGSKK